VNLSVLRDVVMFYISLAFVGLYIILGHDVCRVCVEKYTELSLVIQLFSHFLNRTEL